MNNSNNFDSSKIILAKWKDRFFAWVIDFVIISLISTSIVFISFLYINQNFEEISSTIKLADTFYENSFYSIKDIPINFRFSILVARRVYRKIGLKILNKKNLENYQNSGKIYVSSTEKILETFLSILDLIKLTFSYKRDDQIQHDHNLINEDINLDERI